MGISSEDANAMNEFVCNECVQKQKTVEEEELYCICRQPYDETKYVLRQVLIQGWKKIDEMLNNCRKFENFNTQVPLREQTLMVVGYYV